MSQALPVWLATGTIQTVWPSRFLALKRCMLREAAAAGGQDPLMPISPRAQLGTGIHSLFERAATDPSFPAEPAGLSLEWDKMIAQAEHTISIMPYMQAAVPLARSIPNIGLIRSRTLISLAEVRTSAPSARIASAASAPPSQSGKLSNRDATVIGIPDRIAHTPEGVVISDFKTGTFLQPDGSVSPDYQAQLQLYAALYHENHSVWPTRLEIVSITGSRIPVPATPEACQKQLNAAHKLCLKARTATPALASNAQKQTDAANPKSETCRFCPFRPRCPAYVASALSATPLCQGDVAGTLRRWSTSGNGAILVEVDRTPPTLTVRSIAPTGPSVAALSSAHPGDSVLFVNVKQDTETLFTATNYTALHTYLTPQ